MNLTDAAVKQAKPNNSGRRVIADEHRDAPRGFCLVVRKTGTRAFALRYRSEDGHDRMITIGEYPAWSLSAARKRATELRREIDAGGDPLEEKRDRREAPTVADVVREYDRRHVANLKSANGVRAVLTNHLLPALGKHKIADVRRRDVIQMVERLAEPSPRQASLLLIYTKQVFAFAQDREYIEGDPISSIKPAKVHPTMTPKSRERVLSEDEIRAVLADTRYEGMTPRVHTILKLILLTGQRPGEVAGMRWSEVGDNEWIIPAERRGKTGTRQTVPLTKWTRALLDEARLWDKGDGLVFSSREGQAITTSALSRAIGRVDALRDDGADRWTPHDLRRTMRTGLAAAGISETVAEAAVGHTRKGIAGVYDRHSYSAEVRAALEAWERRLHSIVEGEQGGANNVVPLKAGRTQ